MAETLFHCDDALWHRFTELCRDRDETPGAVLRDLVRLEVKRHAARSARSDEVIDERLLVRLRLLVAEALAECDDWLSLQAALLARGLSYAPAGGGLNLVAAADGRTLAKASLVGPAYLALARRFGAGFPGHPNTTITARALTPLVPASGVPGSADAPAR